MKTKTIAKCHSLKMILLTSSVLLMLRVASAQCDPPPSGLVSWWPMDGTPNDFMLANQPSATNAVNFPLGKVGQGVSLGNGGYIEIPHSPNLASQTITLQAWARPDGPGPNPGVSIILEKGLPFPAASTGSSIALAWDGQSHKFEFSFFDQSAHVISSQSTFDPGVVYHIVGTYDGNLFQLFVNGELQGVLQANTAISYDASFPWIIGATSDNVRGAGYPRTWNGMIDEVAIFNRAVSSNEIASIYAAGSAGMCRSPFITSQPQSQLGFWGQTMAFSVGALPLPVNYQWQSNGVAILGATNQTLSLTNLQNSFAAGYTVVVSNPYGSVTTAPPANLTINPAGVGIALYPGVKIDGVVGLTYGIQYSTNLANPNGWIGVTNLTFTQPTEIWYDAIPASLAQRFYRVLQGPIPIP